MHGQQNIKIKLSSFTLLPPGRRDNFEIIFKMIYIYIYITFMWLREGFTFGYSEQGNNSSVCTKEENFLIIWATTSCTVQCKLISGLKTFSA